MNPVARFERFVEKIMEGTMLKATKSRLQPVEIAKRLARVMDADQVVGPLGVRVPNIFDVELSPEDFSQFKTYQSSVTSEIETYLAKVARERNYVLASTPIVRLREQHEFRAGEFGVRANMEDIQPSALVPVDAVGAPVAQHTAAMPAVANQTPGPAPRRHVSRLIGGIYTFQLETTLITAGRGPENGIAIDNRRVSRRHAQLSLLQGHWQIQDLGSTNGTAVNGTITTQAQLRDGDRVSLGGFELIFKE